ncbi:DUF485 domain-containing protein [Embleya sp. NBC_00896]|uniref:DUF485 domain-containing protein n=1 Tax=Embleya sp. NBC_00896 TaxID=2975961 RepID=UPI003870EDDB|nr:DUF485 domain-containing protein [Embleya sp. NBC_00896]
MPTPHEETHERPPERDPASSPGDGKPGVPHQRAEYVDDRTGYFEMEQDPRFVGLKKRQRSFIFPVTAAFLAWFLLYVVMSAYARDFMAKELFDHINVALVFGLLQFVSTFVIAWAYSRFARIRLDPVAIELREELEA